MEKNKGSISCFEQGPAVLSAARMISAAAAVSPLHPCPQGSFPCIGALEYFLYTQRNILLEKKSTVLQGFLKKLVLSSDYLKFKGYVAS